MTSAAAFLLGCVCAWMLRRREPEPIAGVSGTLVNWRDLERVDSV